jgi:hypothetical protein
MSFKTYLYYYSTLFRYCIYDDDDDDNNNN